MMKNEIETQEQYLKRIEAAAKTLTQDQIDACAWAMGASGCGWTRQGVLRELKFSTT
jgi:hypothetical protein